MSQFTMVYSGDVRKPQVKDIGGKKAVEFQLMRKNYAKDQAAEATFSWVRVTVFDVKDWQVEQCQEGRFVSGHGEFTMRSFTDKDGNKRQSAEVRSTSFQLDAPRTEDKGAIGHHAAKPYDSQANRAGDPPRAPRRPAPSPDDDPNSPPF